MFGKVNNFLSNWTEKLYSLEYTNDIPEVFSCYIMCDDVSRANVGLTDSVRVSKATMIIKPTV
jgi:hypothetical protein